MGISRAFTASTNNFKYVFHSTAGLNAILQKRPLRLDAALAGITRWGTSVDSELRHSFYIKPQ